MMKRNGLGFAAMLAFGALAMAAQTSAPVKDDLFAGTEMFAKGASDVTEITMDPASLGMVGGKEKMKAHDMVLNVVRTYEYDKPGMYRIEDVETFRNKLNTGDWHCSVHTRSLKTGESTDICNKQRSDGMSETAIITVEPKELTFIHTIRKKGPNEGEVDGMPLSMMMGLHGLSSMAMLDPDSIVEMAMLKAQMGSAKNFSFGPESFSHGSGSSPAPKSFMLDIPDNKELHDSNGKPKKQFLMVLPRAQDPSQPLETDKPAPSTSTQPK